MNKVVLSLVGVVIGTIVGVIAAAYIGYFVGMVVSLTTFGILGVEDALLPEIFAWVFVGAGVLAAAIGSGRGSN